MQAIVPLGKGMAKIAVSTDYKRKKDRDEQQGGDSSNAPAAAEEEVPF